MGRIAERCEEGKPLFDRLHAISKQLRTEQDGRVAIAVLTDHRTIGVRLMTTCDSLAWAPDNATRMLEAIEAKPGLHDLP